MTKINRTSGHVWVHHQKSKSGPDTVKAFQEVLKKSNGRKPKHIQVGEGNEFINNIKYKFISC